jgi:hypothetical protein
MDIKSKNIIYLIVPQVAPTSEYSVRTRLGGGEGATCPPYDAVIVVAEAAKE